MAGHGRTEKWRRKIMKEIQGWRGALTNQEPAWEARCLAVKETEITHVGRKETQEMCEGHLPVWLNTRKSIKCLNSLKHCRLLKVPGGWGVGGSTGSHSSTSHPHCCLVKTGPRAIPSTPVIQTANPSLKPSSLKNSNHFHRFSYEDYVTDIWVKKWLAANHM